MLPYIDDFARSLPADNRLTVMALEAGETVGLEKVVHMGAEAQAIHMLLTLHCRSLERVELCRRLWNTVYEFYDAACQIWAAVPQDGELLAVHRGLLIHLRETAHDRVQLYTVTSSERANYCSRKVEEKVGVAHHHYYRREELAGERVVPSSGGKGMKSSLSS